MGSIIPSSDHNIVITISIQVVQRSWSKDTFPSSRNGNNTITLIKHAMQCVLCWHMICKVFKYQFYLHTYLHYYTLAVWELVYNYHCLCRIIPHNNNKVPLVGSSGYEHFGLIVFSLQPYQRFLSYYMNLLHHLINEGFIRFTHSPLLVVADIILHIHCVFISILFMIYTI